MSKQYKLYDGRKATAMFSIDVLKLRAVMGAMAKNDLRSYLNGLFLDYQPGSPEQTKLVATDGTIMATSPVDVVNAKAIDALIEKRKQDKSLQACAESLVFTPQKLPQASMGCIFFDLDQCAYWSEEKGKDWPLTMIAAKYVNWRMVDPWSAGDWEMEDFSEGARPVILDFKRILRLLPDDAYVEIHPGKRYDSTKWFATRLAPTNLRLSDVRLTIMEAKPNAKPNAKA